jgi:hypothetical protein
MSSRWTGPGGVWILYIRGVDRLDEKDKHFYLYRVPDHCAITFYQSTATYRKRINLFPHMYLDSRVGNLKSREEEKIKGCRKFVGTE